MNLESRVKFGALSPVTSETQLLSTVNALVTAMIPLVGQHSNKNERVVQWADLLSLGLANVKGLSEEGLPDYGLPPPTPPDLTPPPGIVGFKVEASFNFVTLSWEPSQHKNHAYVEVWRAAGFKKNLSGVEVPTVLSDAVFRLMTASAVCSDSVLPGDKWRYWARSVSKSGVFGPWTSVDGHLAEVPEDPAYLIDKISGEIRQGDLYPALGNKIEASFLGYQENSLLISAHGQTLAQHTNTLSSHGAAIQQQSTILSDHTTLISAAWTVRIDSGNAVSGFGLMVNGATGQSDFVIRADRFAIAAPQAYDQSGKPVVSTAAFPFIVDVTNPSAPKVLIKNAYIDQAFIQTLVTGSLVADRITGQTLTGTHIRGGDMAVGNNFSVDSAGSATMLNAFIRGTVQSSNYGAGNAGWQIHYDGNAEFNNAVLRGTVYATGGWFQGTVYADKMVGGVYSYAGKDSQANSGVTTVGQWVHAFATNVVRGMAISRFLRVAGPLCRIGLWLGGTGSGGTTYQGSATFVARLLRDGAVVATKTVTLSGISPGAPHPSGSTSYADAAVFEIDFLTAVPADGAVHAYEVQYQISSVDTPVGGDLSASVSTNPTGTPVTYRSAVSLFINTGDLT